MGRRLTRGWHLYVRSGVWWISYPLDGGTKRESTRERELTRAQAYLDRRRAEAAPAIAAVVGVAPCTTCVPVPAPMVALSLSLLERARAYDVSRVVQLGIRLASAIRQHEFDVGALPDWRR